ncbi:hypothetical protein [Pelagibacterium halotolerans]|uniref:Uncharacterized protein n=1 Tax=Pelagibacterium halotolerans (strain DSM 22347 / JCM 15775 / CGMCC 1.7692 / B2) TaxID=1082931 RepID=G4RFY9_PELHB|nr:hypothetical protein [Pelagibacterium halotolerans]AEQ51032.1 hypothetical protein KKY_997 [Pelagibacterium halotolerans B2]QJR19080.1 hypothetical protein HKM20_11905 [Pelagibacterium halotolerans]SEA03007.1 hypothetical protein SAMN05428936_101921 [Pelagibacterium halotolerans]
MDDVARHEWFVAGTTGEREVAAFWIAGSLKKIEERARREHGPDGQRPTRFELMLALCIAVGAIGTAFLLL